ncbi:aldo/keto reductase [Streptomyces tendae]|uniref:aldo/keto reductase n=1 Tax=Streptomyces tendae TaxID=1932 RepID=UPI0036B1EF1F
MQLVPLGTTGLRVSEFCLGGVTLGASWGIGAEEPEARRMIGTFREAGGNFIDTADMYGGGESESIIGRAVEACREEFVLATKFSMVNSALDANSLGNHRRNLTVSLNRSLTRLRTDYVDLMWVHAWYFENRLDDTLRALDDLVRAGKVLYWGMSDTPAWVCAQACVTTRLRGWAPLSAVQFEYSLLERTSDREIIPFAQANGVAALGSVPLGRGLLTGKHHRPGEKVDSRRVTAVAARISPHVDRIVRVLIDVSAATGISAARLAVAWIRQRHPGIIPLLGARTTGQLQELLPAAETEIPTGELDLLEKESDIPLGFPHEMSRRASTVKVMYGPFTPLPPVAP